MVTTPSQTLNLATVLSVTPHWLVVLRNTGLRHSAYEAAAIGWGLLTALSRLAAAAAAAVLNQLELIRVIALYTLVSAVGSSNSQGGVGLCADVGLCVLDVAYRSYVQIVHIVRGRAAEKIFTVIVRVLLETSASHCFFSFFFSFFSLKDKGWPACDWPALLQHSHLAPALGSAHTTGHQIWPPGSYAKRRWPTFFVHLATVLPRWPKKLSASQSVLAATCVLSNCRWDSQICVLVSPEDLLLPVLVYPASAGTRCDSPHSTVISSDNLVLPVFVFFSRWDSLKEPVKIAMIGKYTALSDAYLSVIKALQHACMAAGLKLSLDWVEAQYLEPEAKETDAAKYETSWQQVRLNIAALYMSLPRMDS
jgi:hypothetical protein